MEMLSKPTLNTAIGRSTGKVILMGEHAVVHQQPAIAIPFSGVHVHAHIRKSKHPLSISCDFYSGVAYQMPEVLKSLKFAIHRSLEVIQELRPELTVPVPTRSYWQGHAITNRQSAFAECPNLHIEIESSIPAERGMGSSAAVAVAVVRGLFAYYQVPLNDSTLYEIVQASEKIAHGNPSGIDTATTSGKNPIYFIKGQEPEAVALKMDAVLIVADTGVTGHTLEAVQAVQQLLNTSSTAQEALQQIGTLTQQARFALENNQASVLGQLMTQNHRLLQQLAVSNEPLDHLVTTALEAGALGAKMTGGGLGGCMIALASNLKEATRVSQALAQAGATQTWHHLLNEA